MRLRARFRHWLADKILGPHSEDDWEGCWACQEWEPVEPDYYENGMAVYDMDKRIAELDPDTAAFTTMLRKVKQSS